MLYQQLVGIFQFFFERPEIQDQWVHAREAVGQVLFQKPYRPRTHVILLPAPRAFSGLLVGGYRTTHVPGQVRVLFPPVHTLMNMIKYHIHLGRTKRLYGRTLECYQQRAGQELTRDIPLIVPLEGLLVE